MEEARIQLNAMTGGIEEGGDMMERLAEMARMARLPFRDLTSFAVQLLPTLQGETKELEKWFDITRRTATLNRGPSGGVQGATFSLREAFLSFQQGGRDFVSIADRFNISKIGLAQALEEAAGPEGSQERFLNAMDIMLDKMGVTTEMADQMGQTFNASFTLARESALQALATGFQPFIDVLGPGLQLLAGWMQAFADGAPEIAFVGSALLTIVAVGTPLLLLLNQLTMAWTSMGIAAQAATIKMGRLGLVAGGVAVGATVGRQIGIAAGGLIRESRGEKPFTEDELNQNIKRFLFNQIADLTIIGNNINKALVGVQIAILDGVAIIQRANQSIYHTLAENIGIPSLKEFFENRAAREGGQATATEFAADSARIKVAENTAEMLKGLIVLGQRWDPSVFGSGDGNAPTTRASGISEDQEKIALETYENLRDISRNEQAEITETINSYHLQRVGIIREFNKSVAREERDFLRQRAQANREFNQSVADLAADSALQREKWQEDLERSIQDRREDLDEKNAEAREDSAKRINEIEEEYAKDREKALQDHRDRILKAASRLDAEAIREEEIRFARESKEAKDKFNEQHEDENESLDERIKDNQKAFEEFEEDQKKSLDRRFEEQEDDDARRLLRMQRDFEDQKTQEDIERGIRNADRAQDHRDQLTELDTQHLARIEQIKTHAQAERDQAWIEHDKKMADTGRMTAAWEQQHAILVAQAIEADRKRWEAAAGLTAGSKLMEPPSIENPYGYEIPAQAMNGTYNNNQRTVRIENMILQFVGTTNMNETQTYAIAKRAIVDALEMVSPP
jgi:hypothetical protein